MAKRRFYLVFMASPESILIDKELTVIKKIIGPIDQEKLEEIFRLIK